MRDEHFYTRALKLCPNKAKEDYLGRANWYCKEHEYDKAYNDFMSAKKLGADVEKCYNFPVCKDYIEADEHIGRLTEEIKNNPQNFELFYKRANFHLLKRNYSNAVYDMEQAVNINPCTDTYKAMDNLLVKIREYKIFDSVKNSKKKNLINTLKLRINYATEQIKLFNNSEYWRKRTELDFDKIIELSKDKTLALYLKVNFFEQLRYIRFNKQDSWYINCAIRTCKKVVEQSKERTDTFGKTLTYLYEIKLVWLYSSEDEYEKAIEFALDYPDRPTYQNIKKGLKYINDFAFLHLIVATRN